jgi:hypothetical protein
MRPSRGTLANKKRRGLGWNPGWIEEDKLAMKSGGMARGAGGRLGDWGPRSPRIGQEGKNSSHSQMLLDGDENRRVPLNLAAGGP